MIYSRSTAFSYGTHGPPYTTHVRFRYDDSDGSKNVTFSFTIAHDWSILIWKILTWLRGLRSKIANFSWLHWRNSPKRLDYKEYRTKYWKMIRKPGSQRGLFAENVKCRRITRELITRTAFKLRERRKNSSPFVYVLHKMWNSRRSFAGTAKKRTKKRDARVELLFCSSNLLLFWGCL